MPNMKTFRKMVESAAKTMKAHAKQHTHWLSNMAAPHVHVKKCHKKLCAPFAGQVYSERTSAKRLAPLSKLFRVTDSRGLDAISQSPNGGVGSNPTSDTMYCYGANSQSHNPSTPKTRNTFNATAAAPTNSANMMRATKVDREPLQARNAALIAKRARCIPLR